MRQVHEGQINMSDSSEFFFTMRATESEHSFIEAMIREFCAQHGLTLLYYRKFKTGHEPMRREGKITGDKIHLFKKWAEDNYVYIGNYHRDEKALRQRFEFGAIDYTQYLEECRKI